MESVLHVDMYGYDRRDRRGEQIFPNYSPDGALTYLRYQLHRWRGTPDPAPFAVPTGSGTPEDQSAGFLPTSIDENGKLAGFTVVFTSPKRQTGNTILRCAAVRADGGAPGT